MLDDSSGLVKVRLTTWLVNERRLGNEWPEVTWKRVKEAREDSIGKMPVTQRADRILLYLADRSQQTPGRAINIDAHQKRASSSERRVMYYQMLAHSASLGKEDLFYLVRYLTKQELITHMHISSDHDQLVVTVPGYARVEKLKQEVNWASDRVFVAMWYHKSTEDVWKKGIEPAIKEAGYEPVLIKNQQFVGSIVDEIISEIRRARFIVVDYTHGKQGARGSVYYEAGYADGRGLKVISICKKTILEKVHFDTQQHNHIVWEAGKEDELKTQLKNRITAVVGEGPRNKPTS
ncbi:MAG: hypothetical protein OXI05_03010 [Bacteroidota bacterium]|nr:hypothetical protein [Bacteroidota bacterium]